MWIHQTGDMYECSECGTIEHVKSLWTRCPVCGEPQMLGLYRCNPEKNTECRKTACYINGGPCEFTTKEEFGE